mmetsp:Transcript_40974/g.98352  ORF Transcript_40974/g.98352 Transcript_40974/m.98352 type:complete len:257 (+) Transcript_40974:3040-3810(+)
MLEAVDLLGQPVLDDLGVLRALGGDARGLGELLHGHLHLVAPRLLHDAVLLHGALLAQDLREDLGVRGRALHEALHLHGHVDLVGGADARRREVEVLRRRHAPAEQPVGRRRRHRVGTTTRAESRGGGGASPVVEGARPTGTGRGRGGASPLLEGAVDGVRNAALHNDEARVHLASDLAQVVHALAHLHQGVDGEHGAAQQVEGLRCELRRAKPRRVEHGHLGELELVDGVDRVGDGGDSETEARDDHREQQQDDE